jgi:hypothetical protein
MDQEHHVIDHIVKTDAPEPSPDDGETLRRRQVAVGFTMEDLELILHPMVEDAQGSVGSMGDDTPLAVLSDAIAACIISSGRISARSPTRRSTACAKPG